MNIFKNKKALRGNNGSLENKSEQELRLEEYIREKKVLRNGIIALGIISVGLFVGAIFEATSGEIAGAVIFGICCIGDIGAIKVVIALYERVTSKVIQEESRIRVAGGKSKNV